MTTDQLSGAFAALADPTRRALLERLAQGDATVNELAEPFAISLQAVSKHLKVLESAGLVSRGRDAQRRPCRLSPGPLAAATGYLSTYRRFWDASFDALAEQLPSSADGAAATAEPIVTGSPPPDRSDQSAPSSSPSARTPTRGGARAAHPSRQESSS